MATVQLTCNNYNNANIADTTNTANTLMTITNVYAREIIDSRGLPTVEVSVWLDSGAIVSSSVPSGAVGGKYESHELRDNDPNRMDGMGVINAVNNINQVIAPQIIGHDVTKQTALDQLLVNLDGTHDKSKLGANAILAISQVMLKAGALSVNMPLFQYVQEKYQLTASLQIPTPIFTMISGGSHGANNLDLQEFQLIPASNFTYQDALNMGVQMFHTLGKVLKAKGAIHSTGIGGGYAPNLYHNIDVFEILIEAVKNTAYVFSRDVFFGIDAAADTLMSGGKYVLKDRSHPFDAKEMLDYYITLRNNYNVINIEDGYGEDEWNLWQDLMQQLGETTMISGDKHIATNKERLEKAIQEKSCNTFVSKPIQIGTISETVEVIKLAKESGMKNIVSHRSGETNDDFIADFAVGLGVEYVKFGAPAHGERVAKYNRLLEISEIIKGMG